MQAASTSFAHRWRKWFTSERTPSDQQIVQQQQEEDDARSQKAAQHNPVPYSPPPSTFPSLPILNETPNDRPLQTLDVAPSTTNIAASTDGDPRCATPAQRMDPAAEVLRLSPASSPVFPLLADPTAPPDAHQTSDDIVSAVLEHSDGKDKIKILLPELVRDRKTVSGLRSETQQQAKALRRLCTSFSKDAADLVESLKANVQDGQVPKVTSIGEKVEAMAVILNDIEVSWKAFDRSQEHISSVEWQMKEKEQQIYIGRLGLRMPTVSTSGISEKPSDLSSVSIPPSSEGGVKEMDLPEHNLAREEASSVGVQNDDEPLRTRLDDSEAPEPTDGSTSLHRAHHASVDAATIVDEPAYKPIVFKITDNEPVSPPTSIHVDQELPSRTSGLSLRYLVTDPANERLRQYAARDDPEDSRAAGAQFMDTMAKIVTTNTYPTHLTLPTSGRTQPSDRALLQISHWLSYGAPWTVYDARNRHLSHRSLVGVKLLRDLTIGRFNVSSLSLPAPTRSNVTRDSSGQKAAMTRATLLHAWLWKPNTRPTNTLSSASSMRQDDGTIQTSDLARPIHPAWTERLSADVATLHQGESVMTRVHPGEVPDGNTAADTGSSLKVPAANFSLETSPSSSVRERDVYSDAHS